MYKTDNFLKNKVRNKETNAWQKWTEFEAGTPGQKSITITTELKRILSNVVVRYCI